MAAGPSKEELDGFNGQLWNLMVIETLPSQIEKELQRILQNEDQQRELKEIYNAPRTAFRS